MPRNKEKPDAAESRRRALAAALAELDALRAEVAARYEPAAEPNRSERDAAALLGLAVEVRALRAGPGLAG